MLMVYEYFLYVRFLIKNITLHTYVGYFGVMQSLSA